VATARNISSLDYISDGPNVLKVSLDISSADAVKEATQKAVNTFGRIDVVINNAGVSVYGDTETTTDDQARKMFETNLWGAINLTREAVRIMREENPKTGQVGGVVFYMSSYSARVALPGGSYYVAT
jgi:NAD(P)-dependent dehydrogenase (short-subunit alcohol dehydrogenase family)